jgi:hypothetical protein
MSQRHSTQQPAVSLRSTVAIVCRQLFAIVCRLTRQRPSNIILDTLWASPLFLCCPDLINTVSTSSSSTWAPLEPKFDTRSKNNLECSMKNSKIRLAVFLLSTLCLLTGAQAQITPSHDAYTNSADPTTNYGSNVLLYVDGAKETAWAIL